MSTFGQKGEINMPDCEYDLQAEIDDQVQQPPDQVGAAPKSRKPVIGSCVGVLYTCGSVTSNTEFCITCGSKVYCVHNGRLVKDTHQYILVNHYTFGKNGSPKEETRKFYKTKQNPHVVDYRVIPDLPPTATHYCASFRNPKNPHIVPPDCVGIEFMDPTLDIKNGRYLYWEEKNLTPHCELILPEPRLYRVYYYHYMKPRCTATGAELVPQLTFRNNVKWVFKLSQKNLGAVAKC